jgi:hypothetical protein
MGENSPNLVTLADNRTLIYTGASCLKPLPKEEEEKQLFIGGVRLLRIDEIVTEKVLASFRILFEICFEIGHFISHSHREHFCHIFFTTRR